MVDARASAPTRSTALFRSRTTPLGDAGMPPRGAIPQARGLARIRLVAANGARLLRQSVVAFGAALIVSFWIAAFTLAYQDRAALHVQMQRDAGNLALVFEQNVAHTVADIDRGIQFLRWARSHTPPNVEWPDILAQDFVANRETRADLGDRRQRVHGDELGAVCARRRRCISAIASISRRI